MTESEKREFIKTVCAGLQSALLAEVPRLPADWNGIELRQWIADYYADRYTMPATLTGKRRREYKNAVIVNNLV